MIKHIVLMTFKASADKEAKMNEIKTELEKLTLVIPELKEMRAGLNINPAEQWDFALESLFESMNDLDIYVKHPAHQKIVKDLIAPIKLDRACIDYQCD